MYTNQQVKTFKHAKNILDILDIDTRNAIEEIEFIHPRIPATTANLCHLIGTFFKTETGIPLVDVIITEACNEFAAHRESDGTGKRLAYRHFILSVKSQLHLLFNYSVNIIYTPTNHRQFDLLSESIFEAIPEHGCKIEVRRCPIESHLSNHELSLLLFHRVFSRGDLLSLGVPHCGYQRVFDIRNQHRY